MAADARIRQVWASNLEQEMSAISELIQRYDHVAVDSEFPGVIARPVVSPENNTARDGLYQTIRCNVDVLKVLQFGFTLCDSSGNTPPPPGVCTWQFNFHFDMDEDMYAQDSIDILLAQGVDFNQHRDNGVDPLEFAELLISSGLVLMDGVTWVSFYGGFDFSYLMKVLTAVALPPTETEYFELLTLFFPRFFDLQCILYQRDHEQQENQDEKVQVLQSKHRLNMVADNFGVSRVGSNMQTGADSMLTMNLFLRLAKDDFSGNSAEDHCGALFGLGPNNPNHHLPIQLSPQHPQLHQSNLQSTPNGNHNSQTLDITPPVVPNVVQPDSNHNHHQVAAS